VAEQFGVIRRDDERRTIQQPGELLDLRDAFVEKMLACSLAACNAGRAGKFPFRPRRR
jgi:hypothetical protein